MAGTDVNPLIAGFGAIPAIVAGWFGYLGNTRGRKAADSVLVMAQMREWATQLQESEEKCREEQDRLREAFDRSERAHRAELAAHRKEIDVVRAELELVKRRLAQLEP